MSTDNPNPAARQPTSIDAEMAKFKGFSTNNGETVDPKATNKGPGDVNLSDDERAAGVTIAGGEQSRGGDKKETKETKAPAAKVTLSDDEATAALEKARTDLKLADGDELTKEEEDEALLAALTTKKETAKPPVNDRVKRAQDGRRRAEARAASAERKTAELERRLAALETGGKVPLTGDTKKANSDTSDKEPEPKDFEFGEVDPKYIRALARWEATQVAAEATKTSRLNLARPQMPARRRSLQRNVEHSRMLLTNSSMTSKKSYWTL